MGANQSETLSERARAARLRAGLRQFDVSVQTGLSISTVQETERGLGFATKRTAAALSKVYRLKPDDLLPQLSGRGRR